MLPFFPSAYADETVENRCARFATLQGHSAASINLFANRHYIPAPDLPYGLSTLLAHMPPFHTETVDLLCQQATLLPFYAPFLSPERVVWLQGEMASDDGSRIHAGSGLMASLVPYPKFLRYCPICVIEDRRTVGQAYWHRVHQTAVSLICHQHGIPLLNSSIRYHQRSQRHQLITLETALHQIHNPTLVHKWDISYHKTVYSLAKDVFWLLQQPIGSLTPNHWHTRYWSLLMQHGYVTYTKRMRTQKLLTAFLDKYPAAFLDILGVSLNSDSSDNWLLRLLRQPDRFHHPLHHLLLIHFLNHSAASIALHEPITTYFGDGSWPCLNTVCCAYKESVIDAYLLGFTRQGYPAAIFSCPICGLVYRRVGPDTKTGDRFSFTSYVVFGVVWESELRSKWGDNAFSLRALSRHLGVDSRTVKRHAQRLGLAWPRSHHRHGQMPAPLVGEKTVIISDQIRQQKREQWLSICQQNPDRGMKKLQQGNGGLFTWLRRHDLMWLKAHQRNVSIVLRHQNW